MTGERFRIIRKSCGLTQAEMGELLGYARQSVAQLEIGRRPVSKPVAHLMDALADGWRPIEWPANMD